MVMDTMLGFGVLNKLKLRVDYLRIFLEYSLAVFYSVKVHFELILARYESFGPVLTNLLSTSYAKPFIYHICHLT